MGDEDLQRYLERAATRHRRVPPAPFTCEDHERIAPGPGWERVWADEFDRPGAPDPAIWEPVVGTADLGNRQLETCRAENARVAGGRLVLEARCEEAQGRHYTSARLYARRERAFRYGKLEVKARLAGARGMWSGLWLVGAGFPEVPWPRCGEIDIGEVLGFHPGWTFFACHTEARNHLRGNPRSAFTELPSPHQRFHVYTLEWDAERIRIGADGATYLTCEREGSADPASWPFDVPFRPVLGLSVGGDWGGRFGVDVAALPQRMEIAYVRVWRRA